MKYLRPSVVNSFLAAFMPNLVSSGVPLLFNQFPLVHSINQCDNNLVPHMHTLRVSVYSKEFSVYIFGAFGEQFKISG